MTKKSYIFFVLEIVFLFFVVSVSLVQMEVVNVGYNIGSFSFDISSGAGASNAYLHTGFVGYIFAILFNLSLKGKAKKSTYLLAVLGLLSFGIEFSKVFAYIPFVFVIRPDLIILIIDGLNFYKLKKS